MHMQKHAHKQHQSDIFLQPVIVGAVTLAAAVAGDFAPVAFSRFCCCIVTGQSLWLRSRSLRCARSFRSEATSDYIQQIQHKHTASNMSWKLVARKKIARTRHDGMEEKRSAFGDPITTNNHHQQTLSKAHTGRHSSQKKAGSDLQLCVLPCQLLRALLQGRYPLLSLLPTASGSFSVTEEWHKDSTCTNAHCMDT